MQLKSCGEWGGDGGGLLGLLWGQLQSPALTFQVYPLPLWHPQLSLLPGDLDPKQVVWCL